MISATALESESQNANERAPQSAKNMQTGISTISAIQVEVIAGRVIACDSLIVAPLEDR